MSSGLQADFFLEVQVNQNLCVFACVYVCIHVLRVCVYMYCVCVWYVCVYECVCVCARAQVNLALSVEQLMPDSLRRKLIIKEHQVKPNRKPNPYQWFRYEVLKVQRAASAELVENALNPPIVSLENLSSIPFLSAHAPFHILLVPV